MIPQYEEMMEQYEKERFQFTGPDKLEQAFHVPKPMHEQVEREYLNRVTNEMQLIQDGWYDDPKPSNAHLSNEPAFKEAEKHMADLICQEINHHIISELAKLAEDENKRTAYDKAMKIV